jgi:hypothetical protein
MLIETPAGSEYTIGDCKEWMLQPSFREVIVQALDEVHTAVIGMKSKGKRSAPIEHQLIRVSASSSPY